METLFQKLDDLQKQLEENLLVTKDYLDLREASRYLKLSESAVYKLTSSNGITYYQPGGKKIYFKRTDLNEWIASVKIESNKNFDASVDHYLNRNSKTFQS